VAKRRYKNPPLEEAICEFRFQSDSPWDVAIPGLLVERLARDLPERRPATTFETRSRPVSDGSETQLKSVNWLQLWQEDGKALVQVSANRLSVNRLAPYPGWEEFLPLVEKALREYRAVAKPSGLQQATVRYINRIKFEDLIHLEEYFDLYPFVGQGLPQDFSSFIVGFQTAYQQGREVLEVQMSSVASDESRIPSILLDLVYLSGQPEAVKFEDLPEWLTYAHDQIENVFEGCIKESLRERFGEVKE